jgi:hypothetical protein
MRFASFILGVAIAGCGGGGTSLDGPFECSGSTCTSGQVCLNIAGGIDAGNGEPTGAHYCTTVPSDCEIDDCTGQMCATCIQKLCSPTEVYSVSLRDVNCLGQ